MPKSMDTKRTEAARRRAENADKYKHFITRAEKTNNEGSANFWRGKLERAERDAANALAKVRSRPATFVPRYDRSDPIVPGQQ